MKWLPSPVAWGMTSLCFGEWPSVRSEIVLSPIIWYFGQARWRSSLRELQLSSNARPTFLPPHHVCAVPVVTFSHLFVRACPVSPWQVPCFVHDAEPISKVSMRESDIMDKERNNCKCLLSTIPYQLGSIEDNLATVCARPSFLSFRKRLRYYIHAIARCNKFKHLEQHTEPLTSSRPIHRQTISSHLPSLHYTYYHHTG